MIESNQPKPIGLDDISEWLNADACGILGCNGLAPCRNCRMREAVQGLLNRLSLTIKNVSEGSRTQATEIVGMRLQMANLDTCVEALQAIHAGGGGDAIRAGEALKAIGAMRGAKAPEQAKT